MATTINSVLDRAKTILFDALGVRWPDVELLDWFSAGQTVIATMRPDSYTSKAEFTCVLGVEQTLPADGQRLVRVMNNVGGSAIRFIDIDDLDMTVPNWHDESSPVTDVEQYAYIEKSPRLFYLYPAPEAAHKVNIIYSRVPAKIVEAGYDFTATGVEVIDLPDSYADPLVDYILYRAFSKDGDFSNGQRAQAHFSAMSGVVQVKTEADSGMSPANE